MFAMHVINNIQQPKDNHENDLDEMFCMFCAGQCHWILYRVTWLWQICKSKLQVKESQQTTATQLKKDPSKVKRVKYNKYAGCTAKAH